MKFPNTRSMGGRVQTHTSKPSFSGSMIEHRRANSYYSVFQHWDPLWCALTRASSQQETALHSNHTRLSCQQLHLEAANGSVQSKLGCSRKDEGVCYAWCKLPPEGSCEEGLGPGQLYSEMELLASDQMDHEGSDVIHELPAGGSPSSVMRPKLPSCFVRTSHQSPPPHSSEWRSCFLPCIRAKQSQATMDCNRESLLPLPPCIISSISSQQQRGSEQTPSEFLDFTSN